MSLISENILFIYMALPLLAIIVIGIFFSISKICSFVTFMVSILSLVISLYCLFGFDNLVLNSFTFRLWSLDEMQILHIPSLSRNNILFMFFSGLALFLKTYNSSIGLTPTRTRSSMMGLISFFFISQLFFASSFLSFLMMGAIVPLCFLIEDLCFNENKINSFGLKSHYFSFVVMLGVLCVFVVFKASLGVSLPISLSESKEFLSEFARGTEEYAVVCTFLLLVVVSTFIAQVKSSSSSSLSMSTLANNVFSLLYLFYIFKELIFPLSEGLILKYSVELILCILFFVIYLCYRIMSDLRSDFLSQYLLLIQFLILFLTFLISKHFSISSEKYGLNTIFFLVIPLGVLLLSSGRERGKSKYIGPYISQGVVIATLIAVAFYILPYQKSEISFLAMMCLKLGSITVALFILYLLIKLLSIIHIYNVLKTRKFRLQLFDFILIIFILSFNIVTEIYNEIFWIG